MHQPITAEQGKLNLFPPSEPVAPVIEFNPTVEECDKPRLGKQHHKILERLREGPVTNRELANLFGLRYGARFQELRIAGFSIETARLGDGVFCYTLLQEASKKTA